MYFRNWGLRKTSLNECLKSPVSDDPSTSSMVNETKHCWNLNDTTFSNLLINVKAVELEKISLSDMQSFKSVFNTFTAQQKYSPLNRENLTQPIQMQLSGKKKIVFDFFLDFWNLH